MGSPQGGPGGLFGDSKFGQFIAKTLDPTRYLGGPSKLPDIMNPDKWTRDIGGKYNDASNKKNADAAAAEQAATLQNTLLQRPKDITPDNFLSTKAAQLANLRLGLASTITSPGATLSSPSLNANSPGKTKLGQ